MKFVLARLTLHQFADASMAPLISEYLGSEKGGFGTLVMAAMIVVPQVIVAFTAPWIGHYAEEWGRKPVLLLGLVLEPVRGTLLAISTAFWSLGAAQILDGIIGAIITVVTVLVITDMTTGTGRFNLARAAVSISATGIIAAAFGSSVAFLATAGIAAVAALVLWLFLPESKPQQYLD